MGSYSIAATLEGLFDVAGNAWTWCSNAVTNDQRKAGWNDDCWKQAAQRPADATDRLSSRALRGGAFDSAAAPCRPSHREHSHPDNHYSDIGVRLVRVWPPHSEH